jgi:hypothetical protein
METYGRQLLFRAFRTSLEIQVKPDGTRNLPEAECPKVQNSLEYWLESTTTELGKLLVKRLSQNESTLENLEILLISMQKKMESQNGRAEKVNSIIKKTIPVLQLTSPRIYNPQSPQEAIINKSAMKHTKPIAPIFL